MTTQPTRLEVRANMQLTDEQIDALKKAALAATPQDINSARRIDRYDDDSHVECQACGGEGHVELEADFCNYDGTAIGVQFYGVGNAHGAAEAYLRAVMPANVLALIERLERAEAALLSASKPAAPMGWKLVPVEPTEEMMGAAMQAHEDKPLTDWGKIVPANDDEIYRAMLAASPAAPAQPGEPVAWRDAIKSYPSPDMTLAPQPSQTAVVLDDERAAFEAWWLSDVPEDHRVFAKKLLDGYGTDYTAAAGVADSWAAWQAAIAARDAAQQSPKGDAFASPQAPCDHNYVNGQCTKCGCISAGE